MDSFERCPRCPSGILEVYPVVFVKIRVWISANRLDVGGTRNTVDNDAELAGKHTALQCTSQLVHFMMS